MSGPIDFAALRREREARHGRPAPVEPAAVAVAPTAVAPTVAAVSVAQVAAVAPVRPIPAGDGPLIFVGGACKDATGRHSLRPPPVPADTFEVDCRKSSTEVNQRGNIATLSPGLGNLDDKKATTDQERQLAINFLRRNAAQVDLGMSRGSAVWVHCAQGFNRGPSGLLAYMILYTDATLDQACAVVKAVRPRARTRSNTFYEQLCELEKLPKLKYADHRRLRIVDGANDPSDHERYG
jgi:hypothetical protein